MKSSSYQFICVVIHVVTSSHYTCLISASCAMPDPIANTITTLPNQTLDKGSYITWECSDGYMMDGQTNTAVWVCLENGSWLGHTPMCTAIECPPPPIAAYSELDSLFADTHIVNQTISYNCSSSDYTLLGSNLNRCLQDGTWENDPPVCQRDCDDTVNQVKRYSNLTCYRRRGGSSTTTWIDSLDLCDGKGELLATVKDNKTQTFLVEFIGDQIGESVWIGAMEGRDWKWRHSGDYIERFFWQIPFPSANRQNCIELSYQDGSFSWSPRSNQGNNGLLCQYDRSCQSVGLNQSDMVLEYMGTCFQFLDVSRNCDDGTAECGGGGFLAEILDESTNALLLDRALYLRDVGVDKAWWIGGYDENSGRSWYWSDKTRMNYEKWSDGEPNGWYVYCVEMRSIVQYQWNDEYCSKKRQTLCQIGIPACGDPGEPLHGNRLPNDRTTYSVDATLHYTCQEGYTLSGESVLRCMNHGAWNNSRPSCDAVECEESPQNVTLSSNMILGSVFQDIALYTCQDGYIPDNEPISFCQHTGTWSTPNFTCTALSPCYSNPCVNGGTCIMNGSSFTCTCLSSYTGPTCEEESPKGNSLPSGAIAAGSLVVILFILLVIVLTTVLFRRRRAAKPVLPDDENEMENYAAVANCYCKRADGTPHAPYYLTLEPDSDQNGGFGTSVAEQPSPHVWKGVTQDDTPSVIKGSNGWNETGTEDGFVDNVLYGTSDEQTVRPSSLDHNSTDHKVAKHHAITTSHQSPGRPKPGHPKSGAPETDEDAYEGYEDEEVMVDNELYGAPSPITPRAHKHGAVADQVNDAVYENPDGNVYETYEEEESMIDNELYGAAIPPTPRAGNTNDPVDGEGDGEMYQNTEFHSVPTNLIANEFYKSVDEI